MASRNKNGVCFVMLIFILLYSDLQHTRLFCLGQRASTPVASYGVNMTFYLGDEKYCVPGSIWEHAGLSETTQRGWEDVPWQALPSTTATCKENKDVCRGMHEDVLFSANGSQFSCWCPAGTFRPPPYDKEQACQPCEAGDVCPAFTDIRLTCPLGSTSDGLGCVPSAGYRMVAGQGVMKWRWGYSVAVGWPVDNVYDFAQSVECFPGACAGSCAAIPRATEGDAGCVCAVGYYNDKDARDSLDIPACKVCPAGHYCPVGSESPLECPLYTTTPYEGAGRLEECRCKPGAYATEDPDRACAQRDPTQNSSTFTAPCLFFGDSRCDIPQPCPLYDTCLGGVARVCLPGEFVKKGECLPCPVGKVCLDGITAVPCPGGASTGGWSSSQSLACFCTVGFHRVLVPGSRHGFVCEQDLVPRSMHYNISADIPPAYTTYMWFGQYEQPDFDSYDLLGILFAISPLYTELRVYTLTAPDRIVSSRVSIPRGALRGACTFVRTGVSRMSAMQAGTLELSMTMVCFSFDVLIGRLYLRPDMTIDVEANVRWVPVVSLRGMSTYSIFAVPATRKVVVCISDVSFVPGNSSNITYNMYAIYFDNEKHLLDHPVPRTVSSETPAGIDMNAAQIWTYGDALALLFLGPDGAVLHSLVLDEKLAAFEARAISPELLGKTLYQEALVPIRTVLQDELYYSTPAVVLNTPVPVIGSISENQTAVSRVAIGVIQSARSLARHDWPKHGLVCPPGFARASSPVPFCLICAVGAYCIDGLAFRCPKDTLSVPGSFDVKHCMCSPGYFLSNASNTCLLCPLGFVCSGTTLEPMSCPVGTHTLKVGATDVSMCNCVPGLYRAHKLSPECTPLPIGLYANTNGTLVLECPENKTTLSRASVGLNKCVCNKGYCESAGQRCERCRANVPCNANTSCLDATIECGPAYELAQTLDRCVCRAGYISTTERMKGGSTCSLCPRGYYCNEPLGISMTPCPLLMTSQSMGLSSKTQCTCVNQGLQPYLSALGEMMCVCTEGYYGPPEACVRCPAHSTSIIRRTSNISACICDRGFFRQEASGAVECKLCPKGYICLNEQLMPCPGGTYGPAQGQYKFDACIPCISSQVTALWQGQTLSSPASHWASCIKTFLPVLVHESHPPPKERPVVDFTFKATGLDIPDGQVLAEYLRRLTGSEIVRVVSVVHDMYYHTGHVVIEAVPGYHSTMLNMMVQSPALWGLLYNATASIRIDAHTIATDYIFCSLIPNLYMVKELGSFQPITNTLCTASMIAPAPGTPLFARNQVLDAFVGSLGASSLPTDFTWGMPDTVMLLLNAVSSILNTAMYAQLATNVVNLQYSFTILSTPGPTLLLVPAGADNPLEIFEILNFDLSAADILQQRGFAAIFVPCEWTDLSMFDACFSTPQRYKRSKGSIASPGVCTVCTPHAEFLNEETRECSVCAGIASCSRQGAVAVACCQTKDATCVAPQAPVEEKGLCNNRQHDIEEQCDKTALLTPYAVCCTSNCTLQSGFYISPPCSTICGDAIVAVGVEECDEPGMSQFCDPVTCQIIRHPV